MAYQSASAMPEAQQFSTALQPVILIFPPYLMNSVQFFSDNCNQLQSTRITFHRNQHQAINQQGIQVLTSARKGGMGMEC
jgi:hypothetical protein